MSASADNTGTGTRTLPQLLALAFGAIYLLVGIVGFFVTGFDHFADNSQHEMLLVLHDQPAAQHRPHPDRRRRSAARRTLAGARTYGWLLAGGYGAAFVYGLLAVGESWDFLNINAADNVLHIATALVGLVIALMPVRTAGQPTARLTRAATTGTESRVPSSFRDGRDPALASSAAVGGSTLTPAAGEPSRGPPARTPRGARWTTTRSCAHWAPISNATTRPWRRSSAAR